MQYSINNSVPREEVVAMDTNSVITELGLLIVEGRIPEKSVKGRSEGPHTSLRSSGVVGQDKGHHVCSDADERCLNAREIRGQISRLCRRSIPVCIEVLQFCACPLGARAAREARRDNPTLDATTMGVQLELWTIHSLSRKTHENHIAVTGLVQSIRSHLHFSLLSSWLNRSHGEHPANLLYRITAPGDRPHTRFRRPPKSHTFASAHKSMSIFVSVDYADYSDGPPQPLCFCRTQGRCDGGDSPVVIRQPIPAVSPRNFMLHYPPQYRPASFQHRLTPTPTLVVPIPPRFASDVRQPFVSTTGPCLDGGASIEQSEEDRRLTERLRSLRLANDARLFDKVGSLKEKKRRESMESDSSVKIEDVGSCDEWTRNSPDVVHARSYSSRVIPQSDDSNRDVTQPLEIMTRSLSPSSLGSWSRERERRRHLSGSDQSRAQQLSTSTTPPNKRTNSASPTLGSRVPLRSGQFSPEANLDDIPENLSESPLRKETPPKSVFPFHTTPIRPVQDHVLVTPKAKSPQRPNQQADFTPTSAHSHFSDPYITFRSDFGVPSSVLKLIEYDATSHERSASLPQEDDADSSGKVSVKRGESTESLRLENLQPRTPQKQHFTPTTQSFFGFNREARTTPSQSVDSYRPAVTPQTLAKNDVGSAGIFQRETFIDVFQAAEISKTSSTSSQESLVSPPTSPEGSPAPSPIPSPVLPRPTGVSPPTGSSPRVQGKRRKSNSESSPETVSKFGTFGSLKVSIPDDLELDDETPAPKSSRQDDDSIYTSSRNQTTRSASLCSHESTSQSIFTRYQADFGDFITNNSSKGSCNTFGSRYREQSEVDDEIECDDEIPDNDEMLDNDIHTNISPPVTFYASSEYDEDRQSPFHSSFTNQIDNQAAITTPLKSASFPATDTVFPADPLIKSTSCLPVSTVSPPRPIVTSRRTSPARMALPLPDERNCPILHSLVSPKVIIDSHSPLCTYIEESAETDVTHIRSLSARETICGVDLAQWSSGFRATADGVVSPAGGGGARLRHRDSSEDSTSSVDIPKGGNRVDSSLRRSASRQLQFDTPPTVREHDTITQCNTQSSLLNPLPPPFLSPTPIQRLCQSEDSTLLHVVATRSAVSLSDALKPNVHLPPKAVLKPTPQRNCDTGSSTRAADLRSPPEMKRTRDINHDRDSKRKPPVQHYEVADSQRKKSYSASRDYESLAEPQSCQLQSSPVRRPSSPLFLTKVDGVGIVSIRRDPPTASDVSSPPLNSVAESLLRGRTLQANFRRTVSASSSLMFRAGLRLPSQSSPAPLTRVRTATMSSLCSSSRRSHPASMSSAKSANNVTSLEDAHTVTNGAASTTERSDASTNTISSPDGLIQKRPPSKSFGFDPTLNSVKAIKNAFSCHDLDSDGAASDDGSVSRLDPTRRLSSLSVSAPASTSLVVNFEESLLNGRIEPCGVVDGFAAEIGAGGGPFCPRHVHLPVTAYFFKLSDDNAPSPYLGHINFDQLRKRRYHIPRHGNVQVTLFNPNRTVVKMFVVRYDLRDMPPCSQTFVRQRTMYTPVAKDERLVVKEDCVAKEDDGVARDDNVAKEDGVAKENGVAKEDHIVAAKLTDKDAQGAQKDTPQQQSFLRYLIHLRFVTTRRGKLYLHTDIRLIFARDRFEYDSRIAAYELRSYTEVPSNPQYSPCGDYR